MEQKVKDQTPVIEAVRAGQLTLKQIGKQFRISRQRVSQIAHRAGIRRHMGIPPRVEMPCDECDGTYWRGEKRLHKHPRKPKGMSPENLERAHKMVDAYRDGWTIDRIARTYLNRSARNGAPSVYYALRYLGIEPNRGVGQYDRKQTAYWQKRNTARMERIKLARDAYLTGAKWKDMMQAGYRYNDIVDAIHLYNLPRRNNGS